MGFKVNGCTFEESNSAISKLASYFSGDKS